jgi:hypothetical protein
MPDDPTVAERAVVVQLVDRTRPATLVELYASIGNGATRSDIDQAVLKLSETGVIRQDADGALRITAALRNLDALGLICV